MSEKMIRRSIRIGLAAVSSLLALQVTSAYALSASSPGADQRGKRADREGNPITFRGGDWDVASEWLVLVLPLPGSVKGYVTGRDGRVPIGIELVPGHDFTKEIAKDDAPYTRDPGDVIITGGVISGVVPGPPDTACVSSKVDMNLIPKEGNPFPMAVAWREGFLSFVRNDGRRIIFKGPLTIHVADPITRKVTYDLEYQFGQNARVVWDKETKRLIWYNMAVRKRPRQISK